ncbi:TetR/AcrR family transcriptional regulator [Rhodococcus sp. NPDC047139]|uniref:TetR/AcrR family transcriptional regulator n=1 Tax=Rhodococcus sp. NPDC047139 TaxID=3155141 RepID=UPI003409497C
MPSTSAQLGRPVGARSDETRRRILSATMRCVAEVGYSGATIREIARTADITSGTLYHYFPNKAELVRAAFTEIAEVSIPRFAAAADEVDGVLDKLMAVLDEGAALVRENPYAVAFDRALRSEGAAHLRLNEDSDLIFVSLRQVIAGIVEKADADGILHADAQPDGTTEAIFSMLRGLYDHAATATPEQYVATHRAIGLLIRGALFAGARRP